ncbi:MAG: hypothetical protein JW874_15925 [Spirochaetales bacterium]|nr:hypothetical protein [Spirochaetales bacterium]
MRKILLSLLCISSSLFADYPEKIRLYGSVLDFQWAHNSSRLALLFLDSNENNFLYIIDTGPFSVKARLYLPDRYNPQQMSWNHNDSRIVFTSRSGNADNLFQIDPQSGEIEPFLPGEPRIGLIRDILFSNGTLWSITWEVNGSIDVFIYSDNELMTSTDTNGSFIETLKWDRDMLYTRSNIDGKYYFSGNSKGDGVALKTWAMDPYTHRVSGSSEYHKDLVNTSADGSFYIDIIQDVYIRLFEIWLY